ncbi:ARABIDOPSIS NPK1-ACTIVATING KINESIN 2, NPK1-ACTIVATING KINESIN 2, TETRASPORE [Hibiscus trionum]|uniref:Kinesin-like protein n=1 Tax=Hibiscus trionum TaxID=183268 RepID=A0A9W7M3A7_HIBTR|nr:ARABIDOPSIS NPK1-ACTIVATING KINESIN 2, NPK1-ACTIVATING KINESIN 2, TETRASPORE [Hibiscus trionum]
MMVGTPATPLCKMQRTPATTPGGGAKVREEKILVTVRMRPLNQREQAMYDLIAWDCVDDHTIVFKNPSHERPANQYSFDRVFDPLCSTRNVYKDGAKDVALSALTGINATIFAYGQTSSGKTFTMRGLTENVVKDIYEHIKNTQERDFVLKLSAMEIYNETVVDLLNRDSGCLRLLDDPERGTIVEKLVEEVVQDSQHLRHLIGICEAQRQVGETALNDKSSRSHQIIRLTIESSLRENAECVKSFLASLNLVDLAGSERVSQTNAAGVRLKEGSHINRSLLTLTTVIRKLSGGKRSHIPYRDSKLTRILQNSLGGNARTAIICTISPALSHVEQTRNTLSFATSAKEVINNAHVNMKEVARLEAKLQTPESTSASQLQSLLMEKELKIQEMEREMEELKRQRDIAHSQLEQERKARKVQKGSNQCGPSGKGVRCLSFDNEPVPGSVNAQPRKTTGRYLALGQPATMTDPSMLVHEIRKLEQRQRQLGEEANRALEVLHKEVSSHRMGNKEAAEAIAKMLSEIKDMQAISSIPEDVKIEQGSDLKEEITRLNSQGCSIESLEKKLESVQKSIDMLVSSISTGEETPEFKSQVKKKKILPFPLKNRANMQNLIRAPCSPLSSSRRIMEQDIENKPPEDNEIAPSSSHRSPGLFKTPRKADDGQASSREGTPSTRQTNSVNVKKMEKMFKDATEENVRSIIAYVTELKERVAKLQYQKQLLVCQVLELEEEKEAGNDEADSCLQSPMPWDIVFEDQRKQIIMLWHLCHVSIIHRTQFYLLFRGDPADQIYMEVELRRLTWLEQQFADLGNASPALLGDEPASLVASSIKALKQEREYLAKRVSSKLAAEERELLYLKWDVPAVGKQRRLQLVNKLWTDPLNMQHVQESAELVAKLVGFCESGEHLSKEMFELNFVNPSDKKSWMGWNLISNLLHL